MRKRFQETQKLSKIPVAAGRAGVFSEAMLVANL
jgi:hypothetical protein